MSYRPGQYSKALMYDKHKQEVLKKENDKNIARNEKQYASELQLAGRESYFKEIFEGIKLENQDLPQIGPFEDITKTHHFKEGYKRGQFLVEQGLIPEKYLNDEQETKKHR